MINGHGLVKWASVQNVRGIAFLEIYYVLSFLRLKKMEARLTLLTSKTC